MRLARPAAGPPTIGGNLLALLSAVLWASSFLATEYLPRSWDPLLLCLARLAGASLFFALLFLLIGHPRELRRVP